MIKHIATIIAKNVGHNHNIEIHQDYVIRSSPGVRTLVYDECKDVSKGATRPGLEFECCIRVFLLRSHSGV